MGWEAEAACVTPHQLPEEALPDFIGKLIEKRLRQLFEWIQREICIMHASKGRSFWKPETAVDTGKIWINMEG